MPMKERPVVENEKSADHEEGNVLNDDDDDVIDLDASPTTYTNDMEVSDFDLD